MFWNTLDEGQKTREEVIANVELMIRARFEGPRKVRKEALLGLGGKCELCSCEDLLDLHIHHRSNDGRDHRRKMRRTEGLKSKEFGICLWAIREGFEEARKWVGLYCSPCHRLQHLRKGPQIAFEGPMEGCAKMGTTPMRGNPPL
jgi:hypothetical protein